MIHQATAAPEWLRKTREPCTNTISSAHPLCSSIRTRKPNERLCKRNGPAVQLYGPAVNSLPKSNTALKSLLWANKTSAIFVSIRNSSGRRLMRKIITIKVFEVSSSQMGTTYFRRICRFVRKNESRYAYKKEWTNGTIHNPFAWTTNICEEIGFLSEDMLSAGLFCLHVWIRICGMQTGSIRSMDYSYFV